MDREEVLKFAKGVEATLSNTENKVNGMPLAIECTDCGKKFNFRLKPNLSVDVEFSCDCNRTGTARITWVDTPKRKRVTVSWPKKMQ